MTDLLSPVEPAAASADDVAAAIEASRARTPRAPRAQQRRGQPGPGNVRDQLAAVQAAAIERLGGLSGVEDETIAAAFEEAKAGRDAWIVSVTDAEPAVVVGRPRLVDAIARLAGRAAVILDVSGIVRGLH